ncbi:MAG TPA: FecR domain-containing protein [Bacteroidales bacterium]|nr:FecR domain-containing protein [Bacteroidales bacterium]
MKLGFKEIEELLPGYLSGDVSDKDRSIVDVWRTESPGNEVFYLESRKAWEAMPLLYEMEQFNSFEALRKVNTRISKSGSSKWWVIIQRVAAILLLPLLVYSAYLTMQNLTKEELPEEHVVMQTITSRPGMVTQFSLADGTEVWLNSGSELQFPVLFNGDMREVKLSGEAFFEVAKNEKQPFRVNARELNIDVLGTSFDVMSYDDDTQSEVILIEGKVSLSAEDGQVNKEFGAMHPGQRAVFNVESREVCAHEVEADKYISWRDGNLIFRDDPMEDVVRRLSRWFNVEIIFNDPEIKSYIYTATFRHENLEQVLKLLKLSAPIDYRIIDRKPLPGNEFTKQKILIMSRNI